MERWLLIYCIFGVMWLILWSVSSERTVWKDSKHVIHFFPLLFLFASKKSCGYEFQELFMGNVVMFQVYPACVEERQHEVQG